MGSPQLLQALIESVADGLYIVDPAGRVEFINKAGLRILGYDRNDELLGSPSHATIHAHHRDGSPYPEEECPLLRPRISGEAVRVDEDWFLRRDRSMVPVSYSSAPFDRDDGRAAVVVFRDTTELRRAMRAREVEASRRRLVEAADAERRRIGRDLHDGAQQRLVNVVIGLQLLISELGTDHPQAAQVAVTLQEARGAIEDLRDLASGLHPSVLTNRGLRAAVVARTANVPLPVSIDIPQARLPASVEAAAYFVVAEALTNVVKHAEATEATVRAVVEDDVLRLAIADDGRGGANVGAGSGLRGLADRVAALGGALEVADDPAGGTVVQAELPLGS